MVFHLMASAAQQIVLANPPSVGLTSLESMLIGAIGFGVVSIAGFGVYIVKTAGASAKGYLDTFIDVFRKLSESITGLEKRISDKLDVHHDEALRTIKDRQLEDLKQDLKDKAPCPHPSHPSHPSNPSHPTLPGGA